MTGDAYSVFEKGFYDPFAGDRQRLASTVDRVSNRRANPTLGNAIFLDVVILDAVQPDSDVTSQNRLVVITATRIDAQSIGHG